MLHVLGLLCVFFVVSGMFVSIGLLVIGKLAPGWMTNHKVAVFIAIGLSMAIYGLVIIHANGS